VSAPPRRAEIAGAGFAGLTAAVALARRGWSVRMHERAPELRPGGFGLALHANGVKVLKAVGAFDRATAGACRMVRRQTRDAAGHVSSEMRYRAPMFRAERRRIIAALEREARDAGVEIATGSPARAARPDGVLVLEDGSELPADLVVAADGVNSALRDSLGLLAAREPQADGAIRLMIPRRPGDIPDLPEDCSAEFWSGTRRLIYSPCSADEVYMAMSCLDTDERGKSVPIDFGAWRESFPTLAPLLARIRDEADWPRVQWVRFEVIRLKAWSKGRVAVIGDAAHAMTPNLGQGAMCAMMNGLALGVALGEGRDVEESLAQWERRERPLIDHTQRMSSVYGAITGWPGPLRSAAFWLFARVKFLNRQFQRAAQHVPTGASG
jgi:2-polyprenyl-6-methoxyphenol hydroxylase-like FAD-dependent oxidoreductase